MSTESNKLIILTPGIFFRDRILELLREKHQLVVKTASPIADAVCCFHAADVTLVGPFLGRPAARLVGEAVCRLKPETVLAIGAVGGVLTENNVMEIGNFFIPNQVATDGGEESIEFPISEKAKKLRTKIQADQTNKLVEGAIWTTDKPTQTISLSLQKAISHGALAIDMEFSELFSVFCKQAATFTFTPLFVISDLISASAPYKSGFSSNEFRRAARKSCDTLLSSFL